MTERANNMLYPKVVYVQNVSGPLPFEGYVAGVVAAENGAAAYAAQQAQAVAARTFVLRAMRDIPGLGSASNPIKNGEKFQVYKPNPRDRAIQATLTTAGIVALYKGELTLCNYVAGAPRNAGGQLLADPTDTERYVTYNEGKTGSAVKPTSLSNKSRSDNRGCMSQNTADWLAHQGYDYPAILRYFYGADLEIAPIAGSVPIGPIAAQPPETTTDGASPLPVLVALAALWLEG